MGECKRLQQDFGAKRREQRACEQSEVTTTSYVKIEEIDNKKDEVMEKKKKKLVCCVKFDESLNLTHIYFC